MIKAVWFDVGGTLHTQRSTPENDIEFSNRIYEFLLSHDIKTADTPAMLLSSINAGAKRYKTFSEQQMIEVPVDEIWKDFILKDFSLSPAQLHELGEPLSYLFDRYRKVITKRVHLKQTLDTLKQAGLRLGIISNIMSHSFVPSILKEHGVFEYFEFIVLSSDYLVRKPQPNLFHTATSLMGIAAQETAYIGDTISRDVIGAHSAGWELMIQIDNPAIYHKDAPYRSCGYAPDFHIQSLDEIPSIITKYNQSLKERGYHHETSSATL